MSVLAVLADVANDVSRSATDVDRLNWGAACYPVAEVGALSDHPPTYMVREERIVAAIDRWLDALTDTEHLDETVKTILAGDRAASHEPAEVTRARGQQARLRVELDRVLAAIRAGMDPDLAAGETRKIQADIAVAAAVIDRRERAADRTAPLTDADVRAVIAEAGGLVGLLEAADRTDRAALYRALGVTLRYEKEAPTGRELVHARLELCSGGGGVGGAIPRIATPSLAHIDVSATLVLGP